MKIGTSTRAVWDLNTLEAIEFLKQTGYQQVEFWVEYPNLCLDLVNEEDINLIAKTIQAQSVYTSVHAPIRNINISSLNYGIRKESIRQIKSAIKFARQMQSPIVVVHPGQNSSPKDPSFIAEKLFNSALEDILKVAQDEKVIIALENMEQRKQESIVSAESLLNILKKFDTPYLKATFDISHANTYTSNLVDYYRIIKDEVVHVHISDNNGLKSKTHMEIGKGSINFYEILGEMNKSGYDGFLTIEGYNPANSKNTVTENYKNLKLILDNLN